MFQIATTRYLQALKPLLVWLSAAALCFAVSAGSVYLLMPGADYVFFAVGALPYSVTVGTAGLTFSSYRGSFKSHVVLWIAGASIYLSLFATLAFYFALAFGVYLNYALRSPLWYGWMVAGGCGLVLAWLLRRHIPFALAPRWGLGKIEPLALVGITPLVCSVATISTYLGISVVRGWLALEPQPIFLVPQGYEGPVLILYEQPDGVTPITEGETLIFEIPDNGIYRTALPKPRSVGGPAWYVTSNGQRLERIRWGGFCGPLSSTSAAPVFCFQAIELGRSEGKTLPPYQALAVVRSHDLQQVLKFSTDRHKQILGQLSMPDRP